MNLQKICWLAVLACLSSNVVAMQIYKGKVVSEKIYASDGSKATLAVKKHAAFRENQSDNIYNTVNMQFQTAKVNTPVAMTGAMVTSIYNNGDAAASYTINNSVCSETSEAATHCVFYYKEIILEPSGSYFDDASPLLKMKYSKPGRYKTTAQSGFYQYTSNGSFPVTTRGVSVIVVS